MKTLICLRHAEAERSNLGGDHTCGLTAKGKNDAKLIGKFMLENALHPDFVLCSDAVRTRMTLQGISKHIEPKKIAYENALYESTIDAYINALRACDDGIQTLMIIGHNPVMHMLASQLAHDDGLQNFNQLMCMYPPGSVSVFDVPITQWADLAFQKNTLAMFKMV